MTTTAGRDYLNQWSEQSWPHTGAGPVVSSPDQQTRKFFWQTSTWPTLFYCSSAGRLSWAPRSKLTQICSVKFARSKFRYSVFALSKKSLRKLRAKLRILADIGLLKNFFYIYRVGFTLWFIIRVCHGLEPVEQLQIPFMIRWSYGWLQHNIYRKCIYSKKCTIPETLNLPNFKSVYSDNCMSTPLLHLYNERSVCFFYFRQHLI